MVSEWESDKVLLRQPNAMALELRYGISWKWLMTGEGDMWANEVPPWIRKRIQGGDQAFLKPPPAKDTPGQRLTSQLAPSMDANHQAALQLAIAHCQANHSIGDPESLVAAFKRILQGLQS